MPEVPAGLAKLTRPRLHHAVARERLFAKLEACRAFCRAVCVVGPPGAGKTTLVASWGDARGERGIWFQVDAGDADPATFFYYLGEAVRPFLRKGRRPLPALTPEYLQDVRGFARRFFRALFGLLPPGGSLVLDNYQEVPADAPFHRLISDAVAEVVDGQCLVVISRRDPPDCYARLIANDNVAFLDWDDLRLTLEETTAIVCARTTLGQAEVQKLHEDSGGWAAGVTLLLEGQRRSHAQGADVLAERELLFEYFAAQILAQVPAQTRRFLMITALLSQVPVELARELTGEPAAAEILENLYQRHLFTHRRRGPGVTYWYHSLFRDYLLDQAAATLSPADRREYQTRAARLLEAAGAIDEAHSLFCRACEWDALARLAERHADALLAQGRGQTLREWISVLPRSRIERDPWLRYWLGTSLVPIDPAEARTELESAYELFAQAGNQEGQAVAGAGVLDTYHFEWCDFTPMASWVQRLAPLLESGLYFASLDRELKVYASVLMGIYYGLPRHALLDRCVRRVWEMLDENLDRNSKVKAGSFLLAYCNIAGDMIRSKDLVRRLEPLAQAPEITPLNALWWFLRLGHYHSMDGNLEAARLALTRTCDIAQAHGLSGIRSAGLLVRSYQMFLACLEGDVDAVQRLIGEADTIATPLRPIDNMHIAHNQCYLAMLRGDGVSLSRWGSVSVRASQQANLCYTRVISLLYEAHGLAMLGHERSLQERLALIRETLAGTCMGYFECEVRYVIAFAAVVEGRDEAFSLVQDALSYAREKTYHYPHMSRFSIALPAVMGFALRAGIETDYVKQTIARYRIRPPEYDNGEWPWPIKIFCLGRFEVRIADLPLRFAGKTPRKPLALLKAIIALGGVDVPQSRLVDALWPDEDGDAGKRTFGVTMVRLRKLLGIHDSISVADERVSLDLRQCWIDTHAFETQLKRVDVLQSREASDRTCAAARLKDAISLYKGPFLACDAEESWTVQMRLRLRDQFTMAVEDLAARHEERGEWVSAVECYRRGIEADDLAETFHLGLMRCYLAMQRPAEGLAAFRRLRQILSVVLGVSPSPAAEALALRLRGSSSARSGEVPQAHIFDQ